MGDGYRNFPIFPLDVTSIPRISAASVFSLQGFLIFPLTPFPPPLCVPSDTLSADIESSHFLSCVYVHVHRSQFSSSCFFSPFFFYSRHSFLISGSRQRWQKRPWQSQSEPGKQPSRQWLQWSPSSSPEEPIIQERYQTMNHLHWSPHLSSLLLSVHAALTSGRPPASHSAFLSDYCLFINNGYSS